MESSHVCLKYVSLVKLSLFWWVSQSCALWNAVRHPEMLSQGPSPPRAAFSSSSPISVVSLLEGLEYCSSRNVSGWDAGVLTCCLQSLFSCWCHLPGLTTTADLTLQTTRWNSSAKNISEWNLSFLISCFWFKQKQKQKWMWEGKDKPASIQRQGTPPPPPLPQQQGALASLSAQRRWRSALVGDFFFLLSFYCQHRGIREASLGNASLLHSVIQCHPRYSHLLRGRVICSFTWDCFTSSTGFAATSSLLPPRKMFSLNYGKKFNSSN